MLALLELVAGNVSHEPAVPIGWTLEVLRDVGPVPPVHARKWNLVKGDIDTASGRFTNLIYGPSHDLQTAGCD